MSKKYAVFYSVFFGAVMLLTAILFLVLPKKSFSELEKRSFAYLSAAVTSNIIRWDILPICRPLSM